MASIERTAYPRFKKVVSERELDDVFTPTFDEVAWAADTAPRSEENLVALVVLLKSFQRLGYFPNVGDIPDEVAAHVAGHLGAASTGLRASGLARTLVRYRRLIRDRTGVVHDPPRARAAAEQTIRAAARTKDNPADLINVALEELVKARFELPGYTTLDKLAARVRTEVNTELFAGIVDRLDPPDRSLLQGLLDVDPISRRSAFDEMKRPARKPSLSRLREHTRHLQHLDAMGDTAAWLTGLSPTKATHFAAEAAVLDAADIGKVTEPTRLALMACLVHQACIRARDDLAEMLCRRMATIHKRGRDALAEIRERQRAETERLREVFGRVLAAAQAATTAGDDEPDGGEPDPVVFERAGELMLKPIDEAGGVAQVSAKHAEISAHHRNNYMPLLADRFRSHRKALFDLVDTIEFEATSADTSVLDALQFIRSNRNLSRSYIDDSHDDGRPVDLGFCSQNWIATIRTQDQPGKLARRHLEVCVFSNLANELRTGDIAVIRADSYANFFDQLLTPDDAEPLIADYCREVGLPDTPAAFRSEIEERLRRTAATVDDGYPNSADLVIDPETRRPVLKRHPKPEHPRSVTVLAGLVEERTHEMSLLDITTCSAHWVGWHRHFGPMSGSDPKIGDPLGRYSVIAFTYGTNLGPYQMSRHLRGAVSPHEISAPGNQHITAEKLNKASADVIDAYMGLDVARIWGDGSKVGADGTQIDTWDDNLLVETSVRYGGYGGIAYRHIADTYIALFSRFIPCGVWEAVHIFEGLLDNESDTVNPDEIHADTQGQSLPAFGLATMLGIDLLPRIRNWKDLIFYRPTKTTSYRHIDSLFGDADVIDWKLIEAHWVDLMRVVISIRQRKISSSALLRRLGNESRKNRIYKAFRELGRATRTIVLLRYLSEPKLRTSITAITNRVESFHNFAQWLSFGNTGVIGHNDPDHMEKVVKFNELLANCVIFYNAAALTDTLNQLAADGHPVTNDDIAALSPYTTKPAV